MMRLLAPTALVVATVFTQPVLALSDEGALALLAQTQQLASASPEEQRNAAYASCMVFGFEHDALRSNFAEAGWEIDAELSDETLESWAPKGGGDLAAMISLTEPVCSVWSNVTSTTAAQAVALGMFDSLELPIDVIPVEDGCNVHAIKPEGILFFTVSNADESATTCLSDSGASFVHFSFEDVAP